MKKFLLILTIASMVILDFILRGESITLGLFLLIGVALVSKAIDVESQQQREAKTKEKAATDRQIMTAIR